MICEKFFDKAARSLAKKGMRRLFYAALSGAALFYLILFGLRLSFYIQCSASAPCQTINWSFCENRGGFFLQATYSYFVGGCEYTRSENFKQVRFPSVAAVESYLKRTGPVVSYSPKFPQKATLQHHFPLKEGFYALLLLGILIYFYLLLLDINRSKERVRGGQNGREM